MNHILAVALAALALAACQREAPAPVATDAPAAAAPATDATAVVATETTMAQAGVQPGPGAIDGKAFAGKFTGTLPCADCPGIDTTLELHADGSFMLMETYQERKVEPGMLEGTWTAEENGSRIRLDPNSKSEQDRLYAVTSRDQITQLGSDGTPATSGLDFSLRRDAARP